MLTLSDEFIKRAKGNSRPIFHATIYNRVDYDPQTGTPAFTDQHSYITGPSLHIDHPCSLASVSPVAFSINPIKRDGSVGEVTCTFIDDGILKNRFSEYTPINKEVNIRLGFHDLPFQYFAPYFKGTIKEFVVEGGLIEISVKASTEVLLNRKLVKYGWDCLHPLTAMKMILRKCGISYRLIDEASFDPSSLPNAYKVLRSTVNTKGYLAGDDSNSNSVLGTIDEKPMDAMNKLSRHVGGSVFVAEDGRVTYKHFDDSAPAVHHLTKDDYSDLTNDDMMFVNEITSKLKTYKDDTEITFDNILSKSRFKYIDGDHAVFDENIDLEYTGLGSHSDDNPNFVANAETQALGWNMFVMFKLSTRGFSGVNFSASPQSGPLAAISEDNPIYLLIGGEIIKATMVATSEDGFGDALEIDNDGEPYVANGTHWPYVVLCTAGERGMFGTTATKHSAGEPVHDITAAVLRMQSTLKRFKLGVPVVSLRTNLSKYHLQVGDQITLDDDNLIWKNRTVEDGNYVGVDHLTRWEILSKEVLVGENDTGIDLKLAWVDTDEPSEPEAKIVLPPFVNNLIGDVPVDHPFAQVAQKFVFKGLDIDPTPGGLDVLINPGSLFGGGNIGVLPSPTQITLEDAKDNYIYFDPKTSSIIKRSVDVGAVEPDIIASENLLHKITTGSGSISLNESFLDQKPILGDQLEPGLGPLANLSEDGNFSGSLDATQISNLPDLSTLPALDSRVGAIEGDYATSGDIPDISGLATNTALSNVQTSLNGTISTVQTNLNSLISTNQSGINSNTNLINSVSTVASAAIQDQPDVIKNSHLDDHIVSAANLTTSCADRLLPNGETGSGVISNLSDVSLVADEALAASTHGLVNNPDFRLTNANGSPQTWHFWNSTFGSTFDYDDSSFYGQKSIHINGTTHASSYPVVQSDRFPVYHGQRLKCRAIIKPTFAGSRMWGHVYFYRLAPDGTETYTSRAHVWHNADAASDDWQIIENSFTVPSADDSWWTTVSSPAPTDQPLVARITWRQPYGWPGNNSYGYNSGDYDFRISYLNCFHVGFAEEDLDADLRNRLDSIESTADAAVVDAGMANSAAALASVAATNAQNTADAAAASHYALAELELRPADVPSGGWNDEIIIVCPTMFAMAGGSGGFYTP